MEPNRSRASLIAERMNRGLSVAAAADAIGIARGTLDAFERGDSVSLASLKRVADFYGCTVMDIVRTEPSVSSTADLPDAA